MNDMQPMQPDYSQRVTPNPNPQPQQASQPPDYLSQVETRSDIAPPGYISLQDLEKILDERESKLRAELAAEQAKRERAEAKARAVVTSPVAIHGGGPGVDNHQRSWSLAEQEAARRGEWLDHWEGEPPE